MGAPEWLAVVALVVGLSGGVVGWMMRVSRGLTRLEGMVFRIEKNEERLQRHSDRLDDHATRITVIEAHDG